MARDGSQFLNAHVFPGGQVEASDNGDFRRAALRELYEEVRLHLKPAANITEPPRRVTPQAINGDITFSRFVEENQGPSAEESLIQYARWITPKMMPKRFDTHFFLGLCSEADNPVDGSVDGQEIKSLAWLTPAEALSQFSNGKITLFPPQWYPQFDAISKIFRYILTDLNKHTPTLSSLISLCNRLPTSPQPMAPQGIRVQDKDTFSMCFYGDESYKPTFEEPQSRPGGRHRLNVQMQSGRPKQITLEITNFELPSSKL